MKNLQARVDRSLLIQKFKKWKMDKNGYSRQSLIFQRTIFTPIFDTENTIAMLFS